MVTSAETTPAFVQQSRWRVWGKRIGLAAAMLLPAIIIAHAVWSWRAGVGLRKRVADLTAMGEPMTLATFAPAPPPDPADNAYPLLQQALAVAGTETPARKELEKYDDSPAPPLTPYERTLLAPYLAERQAALPLLAEAARRPACVALLTPKSPVIELLLPSLNGLRDNANLLWRQALADHDAGTHDVALGRLLQIEITARGAASHPSIVGYLVGAGCRALEAEGILSLAPHLKIGTSAGEAPPALVRAAIDAMLDDSAIAAEERRAYQSERFLQVDTLESIASGKTSIANVAGMTGQASSNSPSIDNRVSRYVTRPLALQSASVCCDVSTRLIAGLGAPDLPTAKQQLASVMKDVTAIGSKPQYFMASMVLPTTSRAIEVGYLTRTDRRLAAIALAARWYATEHDGRLPATLAELTPRYLPAVPLDPMVAGVAMLYDAARGIAWSVGEDGFDHGGNAAAVRPRAGEVPSRWQTFDNVASLIPAPRVFSPQMQRELDLNLDAVLEPPPASQPSVPATPATQAADSVRRFDPKKGT
ncbi:MAG TPA: hypothetical protein VF624_03110 [Tepidisphaeraceae bacterium]|jgi:hypothetical protein